VNTGVQGRSAASARRRFLEAAECLPRNESERQDRRLPPQDVRGRDRRHRHRLDLDVGPCLIGVDLQEHLADTQRDAIVVGEHHLDLVHAAHLRNRPPPRSPE
jgi:hypothetical protein